MPAFCSFWKNVKSVLQLRELTWKGNKTNVFLFCVCCLHNMFCITKVSEIIHLKLCLQPSDVNVEMLCLLQACLWPWVCNVNVKRSICDY
jgi:hypothetical protein